MTARGLKNHFDREDSGHTEVSGYAGDLLVGLTLEDGLPQLRDLARQLAMNFQVQFPEAFLAVVIPAKGASLLETGWTTDPQNCLLSTPENESPQWVPIPEYWAQSQTMAVTSGVGWGEWPGPQELISDSVKMNWVTMVARIASQPVFVAHAVLPAENNEVPHIEASWQRFLQALDPIFQVWAVARRKEALLQQLETENQALARLNDLQDKVVALTSHEFKTPLTSITAYTDALRSQLTNADFPHATEFLDVIHAEAGRLLRMANRMVDFSGMISPQDFLDVSPHLVPPLVQESVLTVRPSLAAKNLDLELAFTPDVPAARIDADLIRQVVINLLSNAIKYTPAGGQIKVSLSEVRSSVRLAVADTGLGIPDQDLQRVFREFYRTEGKALQEEGTGLGLTIVRNIMNLHAGFVGVRRRDVQGTEFYCDLPKDVREVGPLPLGFSSRVDREKAWSLIRNLLYVVAELTDNKTVELSLNSGHGGNDTVAAMGPERSEQDNQRWLECDLKVGGNTYGQILVGCPLDGKDYDQHQKAQLEVIADLTALSLRFLTGDSPHADQESVNNQVGKVIAAVRAILKTRRSGIPTSSALSLDLLGKAAARLKVGPSNIRRLQFVALLHDIGMAKVESEIVLGESVLSWDQKDEVEKHVEQGADIVAPLLLDQDLLRVIKHHHEWFDGNGYPDNLRGQEIPLGSRLLAVVDAWFALSRERTFRASLSADEALKEIQNHTGTQFDPEVVKAFAEVLTSEGVVTGVLT